MRVVAGVARGRKLQAPPGHDTRPTADRVREAVFNALASLGALEGATVLDLFAGSGAMGVEALSRGARHATFVDRGRAAVEAVRANLAATGLGASATVVQADVDRWLPGAPAVDLALVDPPYAYDTWDQLLQHLPATTAVLESDREIEVGEGWRVLRRRRYGTTVVTIAQVHARPER
jgi:16S rRNA (guanine966-N2)-methyltransferase